MGLSVPQHRWAQHHQCLSHHRCLIPHRYRGRPGWMAAAFSLRWNHTHFFCAGNTPTVDHLVSSVGLAVLDIKTFGSSNLGPPHGGLSYWMKKRPRKAMSGCHTGARPLSIFMQKDFLSYTTFHLAD